MCNVIGYNQLKLEAAIKESGKSREEIARVLGVSTTTLSYKITGQREFKGSEIFNICNLLEVKDKNSIFFNQNVDLKST